MCELRSHPAASQRRKTTCLERLSEVTDQKSTVARKAELHSNQKLLVTVTKGIATRSKDAASISWQYY